MGNNSDRARLPTLFRVLGWGLAAFTVLLVVLVLIVELMSWNFLKGPITEHIETTTGREMKITGDVSVSLLPYPQLSLSGLRLANPDGAQYPQMLTIDHLEIEPSLTNFGQQFFLDAEARLGIADEQKVVPLKLSATVDPGFTGSGWRLRDIQAQVDEVLITGNLGVDAGATQTVVTGKLHSPSINVSNILVTLPQSRSAAPTTLSIPVLPSLAGEIRLTVSEIILKPATFNNVEASIRLGLNEFVLEALNFSVASGKGEASARLISNTEFITLETRLDLHNIDLQSIDLRALGLTELPGQIVSAELDLALDKIQQSPSLTLRTLLEHVDIGVAKASYRTKEHESGAATHLELTLQEVGKPPIPALTVNGPFRGKPLDMTIEGAPLPQLADDLTDYGLQAQAQSGELLIWGDTRLGALLTPNSFAGNLLLEGDGGQDLEAWTGATLPPLPEFRLSGRLSRDGKLWSANALNGRIGVTELSGEVHFRRAERSGNRPEVNVDLQAGRIKLSQFMGKREPTGAHSEALSEAHSGESAGATDRSPLSALRALNGQLNLRADTLVLPDTPELKDLRLVANMDSGELKVEPLEFNVAGGRWESSLTLDATNSPATGTLDANFEAIALSRFGRTFTRLEERLGKLSGELHLGAIETLPVDQRNDLLLQYIGRLTFDPSWLTFTDPKADTKITLNLHSRGMDTGDQAFHIDGEGRYDGSPFSLQFRGDPLLAARLPDRPYALELSSNMVDSLIHAQGTVQQPLALKGLDLALELEGPNPNRLSRLLGVPLPNLPPYALIGGLTLKDQRWSFSHIEGTVGDSDVSGRIAFDTATQPPHFTGDLNSRSLDLVDLGFLTGAEVGQGSAGTSAEDRFVLPDRPLVTSAWQAVSADIHYRAKDVRAADIPFSNFALDFELEGGRARFEPVSFGIGDGEIDFTLVLDTKPTTPNGTLKVDVQAVNLQRAFRNLPLVGESVGIVGGQGKFWVAGNSFAELLGSADGGLVMLMTQGKLDALLVEMAGLDLAESFLVWLGDTDSVPIDCAYIDLQTRDGVARVETLAVDTADTRFTGTGTINLNNERLDVTIFTHPKDVSALSASSPLHLGGTFNNPDLGVQASDLGLQAASSAVLAAVAAPIAALLPVLDLGTSDDGLGYCNGLVSRSLEAIDETSENKAKADNDEG
ncbi:AsmA family protein [Marinimicrobium sp. C2-29]|uniref:AsmA family protein n=1 Tax=Marinimicrobium sp. C2-29 TaxID=3139825 RepID=UPI00313A03B8